MIFKYKGYELDTAIEENKIKAHRLDVQKIMGFIVRNLKYRADMHDVGKFEFLREWSRFQIIDKAGVKFGTPEHKKLKMELGLKETIDIHTNNQDHHPEFWDRDFSKMDLLSLTELIVDWYSASTTRTSGNGQSLKEMMDFQQTRFNFSDDVKNILLNTLEIIESDFERKKVK